MVEFIQKYGVNQAIWCLFKIAEPYTNELHCVWVHHHVIDNGVKINAPEIAYINARELNELVLSINIIEKLGGIETVKQMVSDFDKSSHQRTDNDLTPCIEVFEKAIKDYELCYQDNVNIFGYIVR